MNRMTCAEARSLMAIADDDGRPDAEALRRHLAVCDACAAAAPELSLLLSLEPRTSPRERFRPRLRASGTAAAAMILAVALTAFQTRRVEEPAPTAGVSTPPDEVVGETPRESPHEASLAAASVVHSVHGAGVESVLTFEVSSEPTRSRVRPSMEWIR